MTIHPPMIRTIFIPIDSAFTSMLTKCVSYDLFWWFYSIRV